MLTILNFLSWCVIAYNFVYGIIFEVILKIYIFMNKLSLLCMMLVNRICRFNTTSGVQRTAITVVNVYFFLHYCTYTSIQFFIQILLLYNFLIFIILINNIPCIEKINIIILINISACVCQRSCNLAYRVCIRIFFNWTYFKLILFCNF
jgi:hypothetical protein